MEQFPQPIMFGRINDIWFLALPASNTPGVGTMANFEAILLCGLGAAVGLTLLLGAFGAVARLAAFSHGRTPEASYREALVRGARGGARFGFVVGLIGGGLAGYFGGPELLEFNLIARWILSATALVVGAILFGLHARWRERRWKEGRYDEAAGHPPIHFPF